MDKLLASFEYLSDAPLEVDKLLAEASHTRGRKEKHGLLEKAQVLANAYQEHCTKGGNNTKQFNQIL